MQPSRQPTRQPSREPTRQPSSQPSEQPTSQPSRRPSRQPSSQPSRIPSTQNNQPCILLHSLRFSHRCNRRDNHLGVLLHPRVSPANNHPCNPPNNPQYNQHHRYFLSYPLIPTGSSLRLITSFMIHIIYVCVLFPFDVMVSYQTFLPSNGFSP